MHFDKLFYAFDELINFLLKSKLTLLSESIEVRHIGKRCFCGFWSWWYWTIDIWFLIRNENALLGFWSSIELAFFGLSRNIMENQKNYNKIGLMIKVQWNIFFRLQKQACLFNHSILWTLFHFAKFRYLGFNFTNVWICGPVNFGLVKFDKLNEKLACNKRK